MDETHARIARRIRELAAARGIPLTHLADRAGVARSHLWAVLGGEKSPTVSVLVKVTAALDVEVIELFQNDAPRASKRTR